MENPEFEWDDEKQTAIPRSMVSALRKALPSSMTHELLQFWTLTIQKAKKDTFQLEFPYKVVYWLSFIPNAKKGSA